MMKWEYLVTWLGLDQSQELKELGQLGWELVTIVLYGNESSRAYFKRPLKPKSESELLYQIDSKRESLV